ncbi:MAG: TIM barrel protein [Methanospirillum sp.]
MSRPYRIAGAVKVRDPASFEALAALAQSGRLDGVQAYVKGPLTGTDRATIAAHASLPVEFVVHAPHHEDGVNPAEPTAPGDLSPAEGRARLEAGMTAALEVADLLDAGTVVFHAGCVVRHDVDEALVAMAAFLDDWPDPRLVLENMPAVHRDLSFVGTSASELAALGLGRVRGYCLDLAHLYVASNFRGWDYGAALAAFEPLPVVYHHLSNSPAGSIRDRHLPLDSPDGGVPFEDVIAWIAAHPATTTCLEYKTAGGGIYDAQLAIFDELYRRYAPV